MSHPGDSPHESLWRKRLRELADGLETDHDPAQDKTVAKLREAALRVHSARGFTDVLWELGLTPAEIDLEVEELILVNELDRFLTWCKAHGQPGGSMRGGVELTDWGYRITAEQLSYLARGFCDARRDNGEASK